MLELGSKTLRVAGAPLFASMMVLASIDASYADTTATLLVAASGGQQQHLRTREAADRA
jgi:hypothetical protein